MTALALTRMMLMRDWVILSEESQEEAKHLD